MGDNDIARIIGNNIKKIRNKEKISQERLAELIGKSAHFISLLERGESGLSVGTLGTKSYTDSFLNKSFESFSDSDKDMVAYLINYINSKN